MDKALCVIATSVVCVGNTFFGAFVTTRLWSWFVVPLGVPPIGLAHSIGLIMTLALLQMGLHQHRDLSAQQHLERGVGRSLAWAIGWGLGAIIAGSMP